PLLSHQELKVQLNVTTDGQQLANLLIESTKKNSAVWLKHITTHKAKPLLTSPFNEGGLQFSPDGRWIVYSSDESGRSEIYVQQFPESTGKSIVSRGGGTTPAWGSDGRQIYYISLERKMMSVPVTLGGSFEAGTPV